ncbi:MAG: lysophospholipid acyltransferase family protein [Acidimicrobiales bacterium]
MPRTSLSLSHSRTPLPLPSLTGRFPWSAPDWPTTLERPVAHKVGVDYDPAWARRYGVRLVRALLLENLTRPALRILADPTVAGLDRLDGVDGPAVFASNHASHLDTPLILTSLPARLRHRTVVSAGADYFFDRPWKAKVSAGLIGAIPTERQRVNRRSMDLAAELLGEGWNLVFFPEGGRSPDGWARAFGDAAAHLARRAGVPLVPVHVEGTGELLGKRRPGLRRGATKVTFGRPIQPGALSTRKLGEALESAVDELADEAATDWWSARLRAGAGQSPATRGPEGASWRRAWALGAGASERGRRSAADWPKR